MKWFLLIFLLNSDEILVKQFDTQKQCEKHKKILKKTFTKEELTCEKGEIFEQYE